jgi:hypothetical protein
MGTRTRGPGMVRPQEQQTRARETMGPEIAQEASMSWYELRARPAMM